MTSTKSIHSLSALLSLLGAVGRVIRIENCAMAYVAVILGARLTTHSLPLGSISAAAIVPPLVLALGNSYNALCDIEADRINKPKRPLPSQRISPTGVRKLMGTLFLGVLLMTWTFCANQAAFVITMLVLALAYSWRLKRVPLLGNTVVAFQSGMVLVFGGMIVGGPTTATIAAGTVLGLGILVLEIGKTIEDAEGDRFVGVHTLGQMPGWWRCLALGSVVMIEWILISLIVSRGAIGYIGALLTALPTVPMAIAAITLIYRKVSRQEVSWLVNASKVLWPIGLVGLSLWH